MKSKRSTIKWVVKHGLCTGCGTCAGVCPRDALSMVIDRKKGRYIPQIDKAKCTHCGLCHDVCPGHSVDFEGLSEVLYGDIPEDIAVGRYLGCYIGHATDKKTRYDGASGGLVTALLVSALEEGLIDGALVTRMRRDKPLEPEPFIARTRTGVIAAARSKYCPVAANAALKAILDSDGRLAVVGLPCHIQGIRKAEQHIPSLRQRIRYRISIACSLDYSFRGTERLLRGIAIAPASVETLEYRGRGWPGSMRIRIKDGTDTIVPLADYYRKLAPFSLGRCTLCSDMLGELSDLSCGDAWVPEAVKTDKVGSSFVITRTPEAEELLERAASQEAVELSELDLEPLLASQGRAVFKKRKLKARLFLCRLIGRRVPKYRQKLSEPIRGDYIHTIKFYIARRALSRQKGILRRLFHVVRRLKRKKGQKPSPA
jgi:coenzyme F420 hydrogenase subunit beta